MSKGILKIGTPFIKNHKNKSELFVNVNDNVNIKKYRIQLRMNLKNI